MGDVTCALSAEWLDAGARLLYLSRGRMVPFRIASIRSGSGL